MTGSATPATKVLAAAKVAYELHRYTHDPRAASFGTEAADVLGVDAKEVFKTLVIELSDGSLAVAVLPVSAQLSMKSAAAALGAARAAMADTAKAERTTGYALGGISPLGQRRTLRTVIDSSALAFPRVFCSAGRRGLEIELAPADLIELTGAVTATITAG